jgi:hypothetical protein
MFLCIEFVMKEFLKLAQGSFVKLGEFMQWKKGKWRFKQRRKNFCRKITKFFENEMLKVLRSMLSLSSIGLPMLPASGMIVEKEACIFFLENPYREILSVTKEDMNFCEKCYEEGLVCEDSEKSYKLLMQAFCGPERRKFRKIVNMSIERFLSFPELGSCKDFDIHKICIERGIDLNYIHTHMILQIKA